MSSLFLFTLLNNHVRDYVQLKDFWISGLFSKLHVLFNVILCKKILWSPRPKKRRLCCAVVQFNHDFRNLRPWVACDIGIHRSWLICIGVRITISTSTTLFALPVGVYPDHWDRRIESFYPNTLSLDRCFQLLKPFHENLIALLRICGYLSRVKWIRLHVINFTLGFLSHYLMFLQ